MKLTKYTHACLFLDDDTSRLVIDPGSLTKLPDDLSNITCVVITEEHIDHFSIDNLRAIIQQSPSVKIYTTQVVQQQLSGEGITAEAVQNGSITIAGFTLTFQETDHAPIYNVSPCRSLSVQVNDYLYYPSDSYSTTNATVEILALPTSGPWHKVQEAIDFANAIDSRTIIATHNGLYNDVGNAITNDFITKNLADSSREFVHLAPGETL